MQDTNFAHDEHTVSAKKEKQFIDSVTSEFIQTSLTTANFKLVKKLSALSYFPQFISFVTASFFIYYILSNYSTWIFFVLGALLITIALGIEYGKRQMINSITSNYLTKLRFSYLLALALVVLFGVSMTASYIGGDKLVVQTAQAPEMPHNAKLDSLNELLNKELALIETMSQTTWRGKVTRDATKAIDKSKDIQAGLLAEMQTLTNEDRQKHNELMQRHEQKIVSFGIVLGVVACLCDLVLLALLVTIKRLKFDVVLLHLGDGQNTRKTLVNGGKTVETQRMVTSLNATTDRHYTQRIDGHETHCLNCGQSYEKKVPHQKYCSSQCRIEHWQDKNKRALPKTYR